MTYFVERIKCPACAGKNLTELYSADFLSTEIKNYLTRFYGRQGGIEPEYLEGARYILNECNVCSLIFQKEIGNDQLMERLYEHWINPEVVFKEEVQQLKLPYYLTNAHEIVNVIAHFQKLPAELSFLDFGMGWGKWSLLAKAFGCRSFGSELSQKRIDFAKKNGIDVLSYEEISAHKFDFINTEQVFEHIPEPLDTLRYIKRALKPDGIVKISVPDAQSIKERLKKMNWGAEKWTPDSLNAVAPLEHINSFNSKSLLSMAKEAGLSRVDVPFLIPPMRIKERHQRPMEKVKDMIRPIYRKYRKAPLPGTYMFFMNNEG